MSSAYCWQELFNQMGEINVSNAHPCFQHFQYLFFGFQHIDSLPLHLHMWICGNSLIQCYTCNFIQEEKAKTTYGSRKKHTHQEGDHTKSFDMVWLRHERMSHLSLTWRQSSVWTAISPECQFLSSPARAPTIGERETKTSLSLYAPQTHQNTHVSTHPDPQWTSSTEEYKASFTFQRLQLSPP